MEDPPVRERLKEIWRPLAVQIIWNDFSHPLPGSCLLVIGINWLIDLLLSQFIT